MNIATEATVIGLAVLSCSLGIPGAHAANDDGTQNQSTTRLADEIRNATRPFRDVAAAEEAGWQSLGHCASGPDEGAMGVHFVNADLLGDGDLDAQQPEALLYEATNNGLELLGVEFIVLADDWHNAHGEAPPVLRGQLFHLNSSPNRFGLPAFYALHVWAWRENPKGMFTNWNPDVSCENYVGNNG